MKRLLVCLLLVGVVGCGESNWHATYAALKEIGVAPRPIGFDEDEKVINLDLHDEYITDDELVILEGMNRLEELYLPNTITDTGLVHLSGLTKLEYLHFSRYFNRDSGITDEGLVHFKGLINLKVLDLPNTKVTPAGVAELQKVLPDCRINTTP